MKKRIDDFRVISNRDLGEGYSLLRLSPVSEGVWATVDPGQFVEISVCEAGNTFLRRPISVCDYDAISGDLTLLVRNAGKATSWLTKVEENHRLNLVWPLGHGFTIPSSDIANTMQAPKAILCGGGVGVAPLLYLGRKLREAHIEPIFVLGARTASQLKLLDEFKGIGDVSITTDDGSLGLKGVVTDSPIFRGVPAEMIYCCGPTPMMKAVGRLAREHSIPCEVSLENVMACGLGACLGCVEKTVKGNVCVCSEGPVFNVNMLNWF